MAFWTSLSSKAVLGISSWGVCPSQMEFGIVESLSSFANKDVRGWRYTNSSCHQLAAAQKSRPST